MQNLFAGGFLVAGLLLLGGADLPQVAESGAGDCCGSASADDASQRSSYMGLPQAPVGEVRGTATGRVLFVGELPRREDLTITEQQAKGCTDEGAKVAADRRSLLIGEDRGIANAVVTVVVPGEKLVVPEQPVVLDQVQCRFTAPVTLVPAGTTVEYKNSDSVPHNVHVYSIKNKPFNKTLPSGASQKQKLDQAERVQIRCDIHPWMKVYVFVSETNHAVLTDEHGAFELPGLPPGTHTVRVWQEKLGTTELQLTVGEDGSTEPLEVELKAKKTRRRRR